MSFEENGARVLSRMAFLARGCGPQGPLGGFLSVSQLQLAGAHVPSVALFLLP